MGINYNCDGCSSRILPINPRFHCLVCKAYDSCQACHTEGRFISPHTAQHPFDTIYVSSQVPMACQPKIPIDPIPPPLSAPSATGVPPSPPPLSPPPPPPLSPPPLSPPPPPPPFKLPRQPPPLSPRRLLPSKRPLPPRRPPPQAPSTIPPADQYWGDLVTPQKTASPMLLQLGNAIFSHFTSRAQTLAPEQLSAIFSAMGREGASNFPQFVQSSAVQYGGTLDLADSQIAFMFSEYGYQHTMTTRAAVSRRIPVPGGMPLLTQEGFQKLILDEILENPESMFIGLNMLLKSIPALMNPVTSRVIEHQEIPRGCFPKELDPMALAKGERICAMLTGRLRTMFRKLAKGTGGKGRKQTVGKLQADKATREQLAAAKARITMGQNGRDNVLGGCKVDSSGNWYYDEGLI